LEADLSVPVDKIQAQKAQLEKEFNSLKSDCAKLQSYLHVNTVAKIKAMESLLKGGRKTITNLAE